MSLLATRAAETVTPHAPPKFVTRRVTIRRPREHDTGYHLIGVGFAFTCSCGARGKNWSTWREARQEGREHAAEHAATSWRDGRPS